MAKKKKAAPKVDFRRRKPSLKATEERRSRIIQIPLTPAERETIDNAVLASGLTIAEFGRRAILAACSSSNPAVR